MNILQYESKIWATADLLRGSGIKESEWPSFMMPFFALTMIESRLVRMFDELKAEIGEEAFTKINKEGWIQVRSATRFKDCIKTSLGVLNPNLFLGRLFS